MGGALNWTQPAAPVSDAVPVDVSNMPKTQGDWTELIPGNNKNAKLADLLKGGLPINRYPTAQQPMNPENTQAAYQMYLNAFNAQNRG